MADLVMRCNDLHCRAELPDKAVVTTCSHIFCLRCAQNAGLFQQHRDQRACPACGTGLFKDDDCVATALNPSEDYKSSVLCGLSPSIIMECATRALEFYSYQATNAVSVYSLQTALREADQRSMYQEHLAQSLTAKYKVHTDQMQGSLNESAQELAQARETIQDYRKSRDVLEGKCQELSMAYKEKSKALAETQSKYQQIKTQAMLADVQYAASEDADHTMQTSNLYNSAPRDSAYFRKRNTWAGSKFSDRVPSRIPSANTHSALPRKSGGLFGINPSLHRRNDNHFSPHNSIDRSIHESNVDPPDMSGMPRTRIPMPVGLSLNANSHHQAPSRAGSQAQTQFRVPIQRGANVGLSGSLKRGRVGRVHDNAYA